MPDLSTTYLGLKLSSPILPSPSPLMQKLDNIKRMQDAGAPAVVLHSLFEEQIIRESENLDRYLSVDAESVFEVRSYFPDLQRYNAGPDHYLDHIRKVKAAVSLPVIASLNGISAGGWTRYAQMIEQAGADALELNMYYIAADAEQTGPQVEQMYLDLVREIRSQIHIPIALKLSLHFSAFANMAHRFDKIGVNGLVLFNRFYQPDFDLDDLEVVPSLELSTSDLLRQRLRWVALLYGHVQADLAITGGVHSAADVLKAMMAGAKVAMMTSALLEHGIDHLRVVRAELAKWMEEHEYDSTSSIVGAMAQKNVANPAVFERANYMRVLASYEAPR